MSDASFFFFINSSTVYKYSHTKCSQKLLMSRKHSLPPRLTVLFFVVCCVVHNLPHICTFFFFLFKNRPPVASPRPTCHHSVTCLELQQRQPGTGMRGSSQKSQCEAFDISMLGAGPQVRSRTVLRGSASSSLCGVVWVWVWVWGGSVVVHRLDPLQISSFGSRQSSVFVFRKPDGGDHTILVQ